MAIKIFKRVNEKVKFLYRQKKYLTFLLLIFMINSLFSQSPSLPNFQVFYEAAWGLGVGWNIFVSFNYTINNTIV